MTPTLFNLPIVSVHLAAGTIFSPLVLADQLITLAQAADRAGLHDSASRLIGMVYAVLDDENAQAA